MWPKMPAKPPGDVALLLAVGGVEQDVADLVGRQRCHLLGADDEHDPAAAAVDRVAARWIAAEPVAQAFSTRIAGLKRNAGSASSAKDAGKLLLLEAAEIADKDRIDIGEADAGMLAPPHGRCAAISVSRSSSSSLPKREWAKPMIAAMTDPSSSRLFADTTRNPLGRFGVEPVGLDLLQVQKMSTNSLPKYSLSIGRARRHRSRHTSSGNVLARFS